MSREEFIGKLQMVYVGDRNAFNDIVCAYDNMLCKNEKAIELLKNKVKVIPFDKNGEGGGIILSDYDIDDLLNILQNGSDSQ